MTEDLEVRFYNSEKRRTRDPAIKPGHRKVLQLNQSKPSKEIYKASEVPTFKKKKKKDNRLYGHALLSTLSEEDANNPILEVYGADCVLGVVRDNSQYGVVHFGWETFCEGFFEKYLSHFDEKSRKIIIAPFLHRFEIERDWAYVKINDCLGDDFISKKRCQWSYWLSLGIIEKLSWSFEFKKALESALSRENVFIHPHSTIEHPSLASRRREKHSRGLNLIRVGPSSVFSKSDTPTEIIPWPE